MFASGGAPDASAAIAAAREAFPKWAAQTPVARGRILSKASQLLEARKAELAELLTREEGKTLAEATGEVQRAFDADEVELNDVIQVRPGESIAVDGEVLEGYSAVDESH